MRVAYFTYWGTIGDRVLEWMANETDEEIVAVISRPGGPGETVKEIAFRHYLPLYQPPENVNDPEFADVLRRLEPDLFISMYFGRLFSPELLAVPKVGCVNMHPSLLPKYRGQGPTTWPLYYGDRETGQTVHWLDEGIDSGDIIAQRAIPIEPEDDSKSLGAKLEELGIALFCETWPLISAGEAPRTVQDDALASYTVAARPEHAVIDWTRTAVEIGNQVRAFTAGYGARTRLGEVRLYVWEASPYTGGLDVGGEARSPGQILAIRSSGTVVQAGDGPIVLTRTSVGKTGPDLLSYLGGTVSSLPIILGE
jgi:methionyl-tRNA formyltransferase